MGGIDTDLNAATSLTGLYAAGECACVSINGANRLGSNSLTEILVFGARAGRTAARQCAADRRRPDARAWQGQATASQARVQALLDGRDGSESLAGLRDQLHAVMEGSAGIYRERHALLDACQTLADLRRRYRDIAITDRSRVFNTHLFQALELGMLLEIGEAMVHAALAREESRGAHQRLDHPERDDARFLHHSLAPRTGEGAPTIGRKPVVITRSPPGARVYGGPSHD